jgi:NADPH:quinone reductase-like Zn-dependent oxidoreductase
MSAYIKSFAPQPCSIIVLNTAVTPMKAIVYEQYGPPEVLRIKEVATPVVGEQDVLVRVHATSVNFGDRLARNFRAVTPGSFNMLGLFWLIAKMYFGVRKPKHPVLGSEFSGVVESVGSKVTAYKAGDEVFGYLGQKMGAYAEYVRVRESDCIAPKSTGISHDEAAVLPYGAIMAWHLLQKAGVRRGHRVLVNGASGGIGSAAVQIAKHLGAEVTGACGTPRIEYVRSLGADAVIDYTKEDFTRRGESWDLIVDIRGRLPFAAAVAHLNDYGTLLSVSFKMRHLLQMLRTSFGGKHRVLCALAPDSSESLRTICELVENGVLRAPVIERFAFSDAAAAHRLMEEGRNAGAVVIQGV